VWRTPAYLVRETGTPSQPLRVRLGVVPNRVDLRGDDQRGPQITQRLGAQRGCEVVTARVVHTAV
jgi:hypothetical protein